ncbi:MAG: hypothetical protein HWE26_22595 [Alteromonadaceae bacterium]|nr:hypothetical protein [Alteromonadaceae bacterium]
MNTKSLLFVLLCYTGNSFADETLCARFKIFAETATVDSSVGFKLESDWSNMSIKCTHNQKESERSFCSWLTVNSSKEFMRLNVTNLEQCLSNSKLIQTAFSYSKISATYSATEISGLSQDIEVSVSYQYGNDVPQPFLTVEVSRYDW